MQRKLIFATVIELLGVGLVSYYPALRIGFVNNDWIYLDWVARLSLPQYLIHYFVPGAEAGWYRPMFGLLFLSIYALFGPNPVAYHFVYVLLHLLNGILLFSIMRKISSNTPVAFVSTLVYLGLPLYSKAVYWPSTPDTLAMFFCLMAIWFWVGFLRKGKRTDWALTLVAFSLALLTKETSLTLPVVLFLVDWLLVHERFGTPLKATRYVPFIVIWLPYLVFEYSLQRAGSYVTMAGYGIGSHVVSNLVAGLTALAFPWGLDQTLGRIWLMIITALFLWAIFVLKSRLMAFLAIAAIVPLLPVVGFPTNWFEMRYLYASAMVSAILFALIIQAGWLRFRGAKWYAIIASGLIAFILAVNGAGIAEATADWGEIARLRAVPFRDIVRSHPNFPEHTKLYFVESPNVSVFDLSVMFLLRYGADVVVTGTDDTQWTQVARLREKPTSYVYYFDSTGKPIEVRVVEAVETNSVPATPVTFSVPVQLAGYEVPNNTVKRGNALVLFLYWRALDSIDQDYTVFVHLVDRGGHVVAGYDSQPRNGKSPTSIWKTNDLIVDGIILPVGAEVPLGSNYHLEVGMYSLSNAERILIRQDGQTTTDKLIIESFQVTE